MSGGAPYTILRAIASGGMGTVYLARREGALGVSRVVALKRAHADLASDPQSRRRFVREAVAASRVHHANVVPVTDLFERDGELWLVLDWVDGASLAEVARTAPSSKLEPRVGMRVVLDACAGLAAAHGLRAEDGAPDGLLHRDVSPQNILLGRDGVARLADFGLAKSIDATLTATVDRMVEGKLGYLAPELFTGHAFDASCDLYAMAVVAWETLAGRRLFRGKSLRELTLEQRTPPSLSSAVTGVPPALDEVLVRALAFDRGERTRGVAILHEQLEEIARRHAFVATSTEVGRIVASALESAGPTREAPLRTPTTGPLDPETSPSLDDAPTPIAADEALREIEVASLRREPPEVASLRREPPEVASLRREPPEVASLRREPPERVPYRRVNPPDPPQKEREGEVDARGTRDRRRKVGVVVAGAVVIAAAVMVTSMWPATGEKRGSGWEKSGGGSGSGSGSEKSGSESGSGSGSGSESGRGSGSGRGSESERESVSPVVVDMDLEPEASARVEARGGIAPVRRAKVEGALATGVPRVPENPYRKSVGSP